MNEILFKYDQINHVTWVYLSSLLTIAIFFKFKRFWSVRNLDVILLILLTPGLLMIDAGHQVRMASQDVVVANGTQESTTNATSVVSTDRLSQDSPAETVAGVEVPLLEEEGTAAMTAPDGDPETVSAGQQESETEESETENAESVVAIGIATERVGYIWMFVVCGLWLVRLLADPNMVRRPLLEPNLTVGGLTFLGCFLFLFIMANVVTSTPTADDLDGAKGAQELIERRAIEDGDDSFQRHGPGYALLFLLPSIRTLPGTISDLPTQSQDAFNRRTAKIVAIAAQLAVAFGMIFIGYRHFNNVRTGIGAATLYLLLPYTAQMTGRVQHVLPAALLIWAVACYRRPMIAGIFIGVAMGTIYSPLYLLPLWISFYWRRGLVRFVGGFLIATLVMVLSLLFKATDIASFVMMTRQMFGIVIPRMEGIQGIWELGWDPIFRLPAFGLFIVMSFTFALWPAQKNLGTLLSCSAAIMVATQFWHGYGGGLFLGWFLPLMLLTIFRPNLEDRVALSVLGEGWLSGRFRQNTAPSDRLVA